MDHSGHNMDMMDMDMDMGGEDGGHMMMMKVSRNIFLNIMILVLFKKN